MEIVVTCNSHIRRAIHREEKDRAISVRLSRFESLPGGFIVECGNCYGKILLSKYHFGPPGFTRAEWASGTCMGCGEPRNYDINFDDGGYRAWRHNAVVIGDYVKLHYKHHSNEPHIDGMGEGKREPIIGSWKLKEFPPYPFNQKKLAKWIDRQFEIGNVVPTSIEITKI